jgi:hypothetical protein
LFYFKREYIDSSTGWTNYETPFYGRVSLAVGAQQTYFKVKRDSFPWGKLAVA